MRGYFVLGIAALSLVLLGVLGGRDGKVEIAEAATNFQPHIHDDYYHAVGAFGPPTNHVTAKANCELAQPAAGCDQHIVVGDTVQWVAPNPFAVNLHSVTECVDSTFSVCGPAVMPSNPIGDSGVLAPGSWPTAPVLFSAPGTYYYRCEVHPTVMRGRVVVAATAGTPTPVPPPGDPVVGGTAGVIGGDDGGTSAWVFALLAAGVLAVSAGTVTGLRAARKRP